MRDRRLGAQFPIFGSNCFGPRGIHKRSDSMLNTENKMGNGKMLRRLSSLFSCFSHVLFHYNNRRRSDIEKLQQRLQSLEVNLPRLSSLGQQQLQGAGNNKERTLLLLGEKSKKDRYLGGHGVGRFDWSILRASTRLEGSRLFGSHCRRKVSTVPRSRVSGE